MDTSICIAPARLTKGLALNRTRDKDNVQVSAGMQEITDGTYRSSKSTDY